MSISSPVSVFSHIKAAISPPPEMVQPPLWADTAAVEKVDGIPWPPVRQ